MVSLNFDCLVANINDAYDKGSANKEELGAMLLYLQLYIEDLIEANNQEIALRKEEIKTSTERLEKYKAEHPEAWKRYQEAHQG